MRKFLLLTTLMLSACATISDMQYTNVYVDQNYDRVSSCFVRQTEAIDEPSVTISVRRIHDPEELRITRVLNYVYSHTLSSHVFEKVDETKTLVKIGYPKSNYSQSYQQGFLKILSLCGAKVIGS